MSPTPLPSIRELFPNLIKPRDDDPKTGYRLITPRLVLDRAHPDPRSERYSPTTPTRPFTPILGRGPPPSEAPSPVGVDGYHDSARPRKHVCKLCGKRFSRPSSLTIHYHTHTGVRPYRCDYPGCFRTFNVSSNMRRHYKNHEFRASNRHQPPLATFKTSFYSPPLRPDVYPPPPLQCGFR